MTSREKALKKVIDSLEKELDLSRVDLPVTLMNGLSGVAIFYNSYASATGKRTYQRKSIEITSEIIDRLNKYGVDSLRRPHSFSTGLAGVGFTFWKLQEEQLINVDFEETWSFMDDFLLASALKDFNAGISDFLHGPLGILYYFLKQYPDRKVEQQLDQLIGLLEHFCVEDEKGLRYRNMVLEDVRDCEYDMGLAHGLSGILLILTECYRKGFQTKRVLSLIQKIIHYLLGAERSIEQTGQNSLFPTSIDETYSLDHEVNKYNYRSRLAWCYGDIAIGWALYKAGKQINDSNLKEKGISIGLATVNRRNYAHHQIGDVFFCHGSSGVAHFYKRFYQETGLAPFKEASDYWMEDTVNLILGDAPLWSADKRSFSILEGLVGLGFVLLPDSDGHPLNWNELFLLQ